MTRGIRDGDGDDVIDRYKVMEEDDVTLVLPT
jgi:hypothetical protein